MWTFRSRLQVSRFGCQRGRSSAACVLSIHKRYEASSLPTSSTGRRRRQGSLGFQEHTIRICKNKKASKRLNHSRLLMKIPAMTYSPTKFP